MASKTLIDIFDERVSASGDEIALRFPHEGKRASLSWSQWYREAVKLAAGLATVGVAVGDRVAIMSRTRYEWVVIDQAIMLAGAVPVPIYPTHHPQQCRLIIEDAGATVVVAEDPAQLEKLCRVREDLTSVRKVVYIDRLSALDEPDEAGRTHLSLSEVKGLEAAGDWVIGMSHLRELGAAALGRDPNIVNDRRRMVTDASIAGIFYTSGTTGRPRGVVLSHAAMVAEVEANALAIPLDATDEQVLFLPLSHVFARVVYLTTMRSGCVTSFTGGVTGLLDDLVEIRPTLLVGVPRVFERIHGHIIRSAGGRRGARQRAVASMADLSVRRSRLLTEGKSLPWSQKLAGLAAERTLFSRIRDTFGGRLRFAVSGGGAMAPELVHFFHGAGVLILEGYGLTENCAAATVNRPSDYRIGTMGRPLNGVEVRLSEEGEVLLRGPNLMNGYWKDDEATATVLKDGWLHTGDIGTYEDGYLRIIDRKRDVIVTSHGRTICPLPIETQLQADPLIDRAVVHGERRPYLTALIALRPDTTLQWAREHKRDHGETFESLRVHPDVYDTVKSRIARINEGLQEHERVRRFAILDESFSLSSGELTPTWKTRRAFVTEKYRSVLEGLYEEDRGDASAPRRV